MRNVSGDVYCRQAWPFESVYAFMEIQSFNGAKESEENKQINKTREKENGVPPTGNEASQYGAMTSYKFTSKDLCLVTHDRQRGDSLSKL